MKYTKTTGTLLFALILGACSSFQQAAKSTPDAAHIGDTHTIVLVHGLYLTPRSWDRWKQFFEERGYTVHAPAYPHLDQEPAAMRAAHPDPVLANLSLEETSEHLRTFSEGLPEKPILIGHSMGGLL